MDLKIISVAITGDAFFNFFVFYFIYAFLFKTLLGILLKLIEK
jgi:hypothetical protein